MTERYHNPYHFVPVEAGGRPGDIAVKDFDDKTAVAERLGHHRYVKGTLSGRIVCRLTAESPFVVGSTRTEGSDLHPAVVEPFEIDGHPAIPGSSLRGLVSSVFEAATNSALRVLGGEPLSYRRSKESGLSAVGMVVQSEASCRMRPLTLPTLTVRNGRAVVPRKWHALFPEPRIKVLFGDPAEISDPVGFPYRTFRSGTGKRWGLSVPRLSYRPERSASGEGEIPIAGVRGLIVKGNSLIGLRPGTTPDHRGKEVEERPRDWARQGEDERRALTHGILRVLGLWERGDIPKGNYGKKHELFLPCPERLEDLPDVAIPAHVVELFHDLADQRTAVKSQHPYEPRDTARNSDPAEGGNLRLKNGDLVFFDVDENGTVSEIAFSSIWRGVPRAANGRPATSRDFFAAVDPDLAPFVQNRQRITPAEQVFGFVESDPDASKTERRRKYRALKGRIVFSDALLDVPPAGGPYRDRVTLKILDSPKAPCPPLYFKPRPRELAPFIAKENLEPGTHHPQGRKFYLHHSHWSGQSRPPWESVLTAPGERDSHLKQKAQVRPVRDGAVFHFHIDFVNLSKEEMEMLAYALRPTELFRHKLGMGKSLGLGTVRIEPMGLFLVERADRYGSDSLAQLRYAQAWKRAPEDGLPDRYQREGRSLDGAKAAPNLIALGAAFRSRQTGATRLEALEAVGDGSGDRLETGAHIHTPLVDGAWNQPKTHESETYRWFVSNEHGYKRQGTRVPNPPHRTLPPLPRPDGKLPALDSLPDPKS